VSTLACRRPLISRRQAHPPAAVAENAFMLLTPTERDRLLIFTAAQLARSRRARGLRLNVPETIALVADTVCEAARDGARHAEAVVAGQAVLGPDDVLPGVADVVVDVKVEAVFDDGTRLVVVPDPVGAGYPAGVASLGTGAPGALLPALRSEAPPPADLVRVTVTNTAAVPVSVSSHFHFFEANPRLAFDRAASYGRHLYVPAGTTARFDPGVPAEAELVPFGGDRVMIGFSGLVDGPLDAPGALAAALARARAFGYLGAE
jgi:urease subunit gamma/beta